MEHEYWLNKWRANDTAWHQTKICPYLIKYCGQLALKSGDAILVPLCGKTKDMLWLAEQGYRVVGVELSAMACEDFFKELTVEPNVTKVGSFVKYQHHNIEILCGDIFELSITNLPDIKSVFDCRALIALPENMRVSYVNHLIKCIGKTANILLLTLESSGQVVGPPFSVDIQMVIALYGEYFNVTQLRHEVNEYILPHLAAKGYVDLVESVYLLTAKN